MPQAIAQSEPELVAAAPFIDRIRVWRHPAVREGRAYAGGLDGLRGPAVLDAPSASWAGWSGMRRIRSGSHTSSSGDPSSRRSRRREISGASASAVTPNGKIDHLNVDQLPLRPVPDLGAERRSTRSALQG
jgi:hypothetical protein